MEGNRAGYSEMARVHQEEKCSQVFELPTATSGPVIRPQLRRAPKRVLPALERTHRTVPFLMEGWGWTSTEICWRCNRGRPRREHLLQSAPHGRRRYESYGRMSERPQESVQGLVETDSRAGRPLLSESGRPGRDQAIHRYGTCCRMTGTRRQSRFS